MYCAQAIQKYNLVGDKPFSTAHVRIAEPILATNEAKAERFQKFMQEELTLGGGKKKSDSISLFI